MTNSVTPFGGERKSRFHSSRRATGSMPAVGSSRKRTRGSCMQRARPSARRCFQPPESWPAQPVDGRAPSPVRSIAHSAPLARRAPREAVDRGEEVEVLEHRQVLVERELLRHVADAAADLLARRGRRRGRPPRRRPPSARSRPQRIRMSVDLPEPLGPSRPKISPRRTPSETWSSARTLPKSRETARDLDAESGSRACAAAGGRALISRAGPSAAMPGLRSGVGSIAHLHAEHLVDALVERLDVSRRVLACCRISTTWPGKSRPGRCPPGSSARCADAHQARAAARARRRAPRSGPARGVSRPAGRPSHEVAGTQVDRLQDAVGGRAHDQIFPLTLEVRELPLLAHERGARRRDVLGPAAALLLPQGLQGPAAVAAATS